jgi:hypothetical protein
VLRKHSHGEDDLTYIFVDVCIRVTNDEIKTSKFIQGISIIVLGLPMGFVFRHC